MVNHGQFHIQKSNDHYQVNHGQIPDAGIQINTDLWGMNMAEPWSGNIRQPWSTMVSSIFKNQMTIRSMTCGQIRDVLRHSNQPTSGG